MEGKYKSRIRLPPTCVHLIASWQKVTDHSSISGLAGSRGTRFKREPFSMASRTALMRPESETRAEA